MLKEEICIWIYPTLSLKHSEIQKNQYVFKIIWGQNDLYTQVISNAFIKRSSISGLSFSCSDKIISVFGESSQNIFFSLLSASFQSLLIYFLLIKQ